MTLVTARASRMFTRFSLLAGLPGVLLMCVWVAVPTGHIRPVALLLVNAITVVAIFAGVRRLPGRERTPWLILLGAQVSSVAAFAYWYLYPSVTGEVLAVPSPADVLFVLLYVGSCTAIGVMIRREKRGRDRETLLDVLIISASLGALTWVFLMAPYAEDTNLSFVVKLVSLAYPALDLLLVVLALRLAFSGSRMTPAKALLLSWAALQLAGDTTFGVLVLRGEWSLTSPVMLLWMAAFTSLAMAAAHPTMALVGQPSSGPATHADRLRRVAVGIAVLALPVALGVRLVQGNSSDLAVITLASVVTFMLALVRGFGGHHFGATRGDRVALLKLVVVFVVCALLPLALLTVSSIQLSARAMVGDAQARVQTTSVVSAELVQQEMTGFGQLVAAYAERRLLAGAMESGSIESFNAREIQRHLSQLREADPDIGGVFVTDAQGRLFDVIPSTPAIIGRDFSQRDWYRGASVTDGPYISEAYATAIAGEARVVAAASTVRDPATGEVLGIIAAVYDLRAIQAFSEDVAAAQGVSLRITDQRGTVVAAPGADGQQLVAASAEPGVASALRGEDSIVTLEHDGKEQLAAYAPVDGLGWTVTAQVPTATAYAALAPLRSTVVAIAVLLGQVLLGGLVLMARAQRQRREAERDLLEKEETTRGILEAAADAFISIDADGIVTNWSRQSEQLFGWTAHEAKGQRLSELVVPESMRQGHLDGIARIANGGAATVLGQRVEMPALHRDGHEFLAELVIWRSVAKGTVSFNAFVHDITRRKRHEAALAAARDEAVEAARAKTEFLAVMSHELRTPMNGVMGMTSLLLGTDLSPQQREYAETVRTSADSLLELLNDVLDLAKVEADHLELEELEFDLNRVVRDVVHLLGTGARAKGVPLTAAIDPDVRLALRGDPGRLRQVLLNLVGNAVKFTSAGSVHLQVSLDAAGGLADNQIRLRFAVTDTGIGIAESARDRLFEAFAQADASTTRKFGGTGLGLAISKKLVALFGGEIGVDSELGVGSTFWFTARFVPGTPAVVEAAEATFVPVPASVSRLVLVVDDNATNQKIAVRMLQTLGHRADVAASGVEAVEACSRVPYDLVLMDCQMPIMDGYDATRAIRAVEAGTGRRTPIVAMTASAMASDRVRCLEAGMDDYLSKPVRLLEVATKVDQWLASSVVLAGKASNPGPNGPDAAAVPGELSPPVLDADLVASLRSLGMDFLARLVPVFVLGAPDRLEVIAAAVASGDADALAAGAHALRGSAGNMGGVRVAAVCRRLEEAGLAGDMTHAAADLEALRTELPLLLVAVQQLVEPPA